MSRLARDEWLLLARSTHAPSDRGRRCRASRAEERQSLENKETDRAGRDTRGEKGGKSSFWETRGENGWGKGVGHRWPAPRWRWTTAEAEFSRGRCVWRRERVLADRTSLSLEVSAETSSPWHRSFVRRNSRTWSRQTILEDLSCQTILEDLSPQARYRKTCQVRLDT